MSQHALTHLAALTVQGRDALAFCQSQLTINLDQCLDGMWHPGAWCQASGLVITTLLVQATPKQIEWVMPAVLVDQVITQLKPFTIGRQVSFEKGNVVLGSWDKQDHGRLAYDPTRYLMTSKDSASDHEDNQCAIRWRQRDIELGMPWLSSSLSQKYIPQALGLERLGGISYQKGCYPGQEVIAKVHYRGQAKQRLALVTLAMPKALLVVGTDLFLADISSTEASSRPVGQLVEQLEDQALAIVRHDLPENTPLATAHGGQMIGQVAAFSLATQTNSVS